MPSSPIPEKLVPAHAKRQPVPSAKVKDSANSVGTAVRGNPTAKSPTTESESESNARPASPLPPSSPAQPSLPAPSDSNKRKSPPLSVHDSDEEDSAPRQGSSSKRVRVDSDNDSSGPSQEPETLTLKQRTRDIDEFFDKPHKALGDNKPKRQCKYCKKKRLTVNIVCETTTLRRHIESLHRANYNEWCSKNSFETKLPKAVRAQKNQRAAEDRSKQTALDPHLQERPQKERVVAYSDALFRQAAIEWLIATDQPIQALDHPKFKEMISVASRATEGVLIPDRKATRKYIINLFKKNLSDLQTRLGSDKTGAVSLTCDAWSHTDSYFAVTGHWIETEADGSWMQKSALLGFTQVNCSHDGVTLGRALYKVIKRLDIGHKVGWVTCDNATNNLTMLQNFGRKLNNSPMRKDCKKKWEWEDYHIRCLAHVINLSTQALIITYSPSKHFDLKDPDAHEPAVDGVEQRDEVGLIRSITVKARSSTKRKELLRQLQVRAEKVPLALLIDMKVRWSSTYVMLKRATRLEAFLDNFIYEMGREESDLNKRRKIDSLKLSDEEWTRLKSFIDLLECADAAQQAFSYDNTPTLHTALPALEALHKAWSSRSTRPKYAPFTKALEAAIAKIEEYYNKTATSHAYTFAMLLDPDMKMSHFKKHWGPALEKQILASAEKIFKERYYELYGNNAPPKNASRKGNKKLAKLMAEYTDDDDDDESSPSPSQIAEPWRREFDQYLNGADEVPNDMTIVHWWGIHSSRLPVWASLARDYLAIMASSVSSERAFSAAGITISKRRNRLKADIVEALQFLKCLMRQELLFREPEPTSVLELELEVIDDDDDPDWVDADEPKSWDSLVIDCEDSDVDD